MRYSWRPFYPLFGFFLGSSSLVALEEDRVSVSWNSDLIRETEPDLASLLERIRAKLKPDLIDSILIGKIGRQLQVLFAIYRVHGNVCLID
ncbi:hypothetical protein TorRG33x02_201840 [Trema orientale]|uniref:Uncharacterized protein n=1 Tax=Trema orientale TaxID=63057 RepID=A0A2P5EEV9_TREOI|nr:hypothetical protein TorRG33x02_201840 [Trema orientale]